MKDKLVIIGAGGHGKVVADIAYKQDIYTKIVFLDDYSKEKCCMNFDIVGKSEDAHKFVDEAEFFVAVGNARQRQKITEKLKGLSVTMARLIHPSASIGMAVKIGEGTVIMAGAVINSNTNIGRGVIINTGATVDHDCCVGDYVHVSVGSHLCGTVSVGDKTMIGAGTTVKNNVNICSECVISTGAVVIKDIKEKGIYMGVPAKRKDRKKICFVTTISATIKAFLIPFATYLCRYGNYEITFICDLDEELYNLMEENMRYIPVPIKRGISLTGVKSIIKLKRIFKEEKFDIVQYSTPNAAFYASCAAKGAGIKNRVYCQWGIRYMGFEGIPRFIFKQLERITCAKSSYIEAESYNILQFSIKEKLYKNNKACVVWNGSASGVDLNKFNIQEKDNWRKAIRTDLNIDDSAVVFGFVGRITRDKGIDELLEAFRMIEKEQNCKLMLIGALDCESTLDKELVEWAKGNENVLWIDWTDKTEKYFAAMDVFVSPSYREGFGLVVIEAEAMGVPAIVSDVPGQIDAVIKNETGLVASVKNAKDLSYTMWELLKNPEKREVYGENAHKFVEQNFEQTRLFVHLMEKRDQLLR